jgi:polysaccharide pyruvyl transferase WcaK-like protein
MTDLIVTLVDAYTPKNVGDLELVEASLDAAEQRIGAVTNVIALDAEGFEAALGRACIPRPLNRLRLKKQTRSQRMRSAASFVLSYAIAFVLGQRYGAAVRRFRILRTMDSAPLAALVDSDYIIAVGGGYITDESWQEGVLTLLLWRLGLRGGAKVETLPISVEVTKSFLKRTVKLLGRRVRWTARDSATVKTLASLGLSAPLVPDLAFRNFPTGASNVERSGLLLCPIGSDYLTPGEVVRHLEGLVEIAVFAQTSDPTIVVKVFVMHRQLAGGVGNDEVVAENLCAELRLRGVPSEPIVVESYTRLLELLGKSSALVSARMHAGIAGLCSLTPTLLLGYQIKHGAMMSDMGLSAYCIDISGSPATYLTAYQALEGQAGALVAALESRKRSLDLWNLAARARVPEAL